MNIYLCLVNSEPIIRFKAKSYQDALNYIHSHYSFDEISEYLTITKL